MEVNNKNEWTTNTYNMDMKTFILSERNQTKLNSSSIYNRFPFYMIPEQWSQSIEIGSKSWLPGLEDWDRGEKERKEDDGYLFHHLNADDGFMGIHVSKFTSHLKYTKS